MNSKFPYNNFQFIEPPVCTSKVSVGGLAKYESDGWWLQFKKSGTRNVVHIPPHSMKQLTRPLGHTRHRHSPNHKRWHFTDESAAGFMAIRSDRWHVLDCELLHTPGDIENTNYVFDVLVYEGEHLFGWTLQQRQALLSSLFKTEYLTGSASHYVVTPKLWLAKNHKPRPVPRAQRLFAALVGENEGVIMKDPTGRLDIRGNDSWMVKAVQEKLVYGTSS